MFGQRLVVRIFLIGLAILGAHVASAQTYPDKPIRVVASERGGGNDLAARAIAQGLAPRLGQSVVVDNLLGGTIGGETVLNAPPDGYTLLSAGSQFWIEPLLQKTPYDVVKNFTPITLATSAPFSLYVHPSVPAKSVSELIALAKSRPGELKYGSGGSGSANHLATELLKSMAGVNIVRVPYKGAASAVIALVADEVQLMFISITLAAPHVKSGRLKALAVASARPSALLPGLPAIAETLPGYEAVQVYGVLAAAGTPAAIIRRLNQEIVQVLTTAEVKERFFSTGVEVVASSPEEFAAFIRTEVARSGKLIRDTGIRAE
jgi:tripartite-type tricarboxylate transporter receptor subunit TctC